MHRSTIRRGTSIVAAAALLASLTAAAVAGPVGAADEVTCRGKVATIVGTQGPDVLVGTNGRDIIAGLGGDDVIRGLGGHDLICAGRGADRVKGNQGRDRLYGNAGPDKLFGGKGPDKLYGGVSDDWLKGQKGNDSFDGGPGTDTCDQDQGTGPKVNCKPELIPLTGILAVAYSDIDGLDGYSTGDVLIAKLVDTNDDKAVSVGDTVMMGRYPTSLTPGPSDFADWGVTSHVVQTVLVATAITVDVIAAGESHAWTFTDSGEIYDESSRATVFQDGFRASIDDVILASPGSSSAPSSSVPFTFITRHADNDFVDVELND